MYIRFVAETLSYKSTLYVPIEFVPENEISSIKVTFARVIINGNINMIEQIKG